MNPSYEPYRSKISYLRTNVARIEENWTWSDKTFPHILCVVGTSDETTQYGICLTSNKNLHWASGGGGEFGPKMAFWGQFSP